MNRKQKKVLIRIILTAAAVLALNIFHPAGLLCLGLYAAAYLLIGYDILRKAGKGILNGRIFDENFLMAIATLGAFALAIYEKSTDYNEAIAVMLFYQIGELFQGIAVGKSRKSISDLMDIRPDYANIMTDGTLEKVDPEDVEPGSIIIVQPGEKVPIDGIVEDGQSTLDTSALTGESMPRSVKAGDEIISGCINMSGVLTIRTTRDFSESTVSKILELVEDSASRKSRSENFISKFARVYTPAVCICALALAVVPALIALIAGGDPSWRVWIYRALTFLVISCPCALVVSIPLSFFAGIGGAGREGILIKGSNYLEALAQVKTVVFDKTGTLTRGTFEVNAFHRDGCEDLDDFDELIEYAALAECASSHPISISLRQRYGKEIDRSRVSDIKEISGQGVTAIVDGHTVAAGNEKLMHSLHIETTGCSSSGTIIHICLDGEYKGHIVISDLIKPGSAAAIEQLKQLGVAKTVMLTGDGEKAAEKVAHDLKIDEFHARLLPADKVRLVEEMLNTSSDSSVPEEKSASPGTPERRRAKLAFVGDGLNDAPVLNRADVGIAMGALGSDAAIEAADVVLMDDDPVKIAKAIRISRKCIGIVYQNIILSLVVKFACLALSALGTANMWYAIFADVGVMVLAVLNAIRALRVK